MNRKLLLEVETDPNKADSMLRLLVELADFLEKAKERGLILNYGIGLNKTGSTYTDYAQVVDKNPKEAEE